MSLQPTAQDWFGPSDPRSYSALGRWRRSNSAICQLSPAADGESDCVSDSYPIPSMGLVYLPTWKP